MQKPYGRVVQGDGFKSSIYTLIITIFIAKREFEPHSGQSRHFVRINFHFLEVVQEN